MSHTNEVTLQLGVGGFVVHVAFNFFFLTQDLFSLGPLLVEAMGG